MIVPESVEVLEEKVFRLSDVILEHYGEVEVFRSDDDDEWLINPPGYRFGISFVASEAFDVMVEALRRRYT